MSAAEDDARALLAQVREEYPPEAEDECLDEMLAIVRSEQGAAHAICVRRALEEMR